MTKSSQAKPAPSFSEAYREGLLNRLYAVAPGDVEAALAQAREAPRSPLVAALRRYARKLGAPQAVFEALERLEHPKSRAVVTGQQTGLLLGPLYTLGKAVTAVRLAQRLSRDERPVVPIFWLASQDHDSAEIDHATLLDMDERLRRITLPLPEAQPSGRVVWQPDWLEQLGAQLAELRAPEAHQQEAGRLLGEAVAVASSVADVFGALLYRLLGEEGLIVLNPLEPDVAPLFGEILARELEAPLESSARINGAGETLRALGYAPQLGRAAGASNLFLEVSGRRELLQVDGGDFVSRERRFRKDALLALLEREPGRLTPAAGLRPISQDAALPTAVMVVGPGELRYFAQLREVYALHGVAMPLLWPRAGLTLLEPPVRRILTKYGLSAQEVQRDPEAAFERVLLDLHGHSEVVARNLGEMENAVEALLEHLGAIDPTLTRSVRRQNARLRAGVAQLKRKAAAAIRREDGVTARQLERLTLHLLPMGQPQERVLSPFSFFVKFGVAHVMQAVLSLAPEGEQLVDL